MGVFDRLSDVLKSYLKDDDYTGSSGVKFVDPDVINAYKELDDFLDSDSLNSDFRDRSSRRFSAGNQSTQTKKTVPENLRADFFELGVEVGASADVCKSAHKNLLKIHHPDKHAGNENDLKKSTEKTKRINTAYERISEWYGSSK
ncbi:MAG: hypothetical protein Ta2F_04990 [Termitinemataceae bacterium]|nr:MAG: hypothetical protein Ta2F_04990 [Termitinemataceae bacterium]